MQSPPPTPNSPKRIYILTHPRSASNLLIRILNLPSNPVNPLDFSPPLKTENFFLPLALLKHSRGLVGLPIREWSVEDRVTVAEYERGCIEEMESLFREVGKAEQGGGKGTGKDVPVVVVKEHVEFLRRWDLDLDLEPDLDLRPLSGPALNPTPLSSSFLHTWQPVFLIRHPALAFPSRVRAMRDLGELDYSKLAEGGLRERERVLQACLTLSWNRRLFDWFRGEMAGGGGADGCDGVVKDGERSEGEEGEGEKGEQPIVLDADDIMLHPSIVIKFCDLVGLDPTRLKFSWTRTNKAEGYEGQDEQHRRMLSTLWASEKIVEGKTARGSDLEEEARKWKEEFGQEEGKMVERLVQAAMPDYEYMRAFRLKVGE